MKTSVSFKVISVAAIALAGAFVISGNQASAIKTMPFAHAAQPTPVVSVTTLPQMPGAPTTPATQPPASGTFPPIAPPPVDSAGHSIIAVDGDVSNPVSLTIKDLERLRPISLTLRVRDPDGKLRVHAFTGALLSDVIALARPRFDSNPATLMRKYVYVTGVDGNSAIVGFPEFEPEFNGKIAILAYVVDLKNVPTPGFAKLVVAEDATSTRFLTLARLTVGEPGH